MTNLVSKLISTAFLFSIPFLPSTARAQEQENKTYLELLYNNTFYRFIQFTQPEEKIHDIIVEKVTPYGTDTVFNFYKEAAKIENMSSKEEKIKHLDKVMERSIRYGELKLKITESIDIYKLFWEGHEGWDIWQKHEELKKSYGDCIAYLTDLGLTDVKEAIKEEEKKHHKGPGLLEQIADLGRAFEMLDRSLGDLSGDAPLTQQQRYWALRESQGLVKKYNPPDVEVNFEDENKIKKDISYIILNAFEEAAKEKEWMDKRTTFMQQVADFPTVAVHPIAISMAEEFSKYQKIDDALKVFTNIHKKPLEIFGKSNEPDFDYKTYQNLFYWWKLAYRNYDAQIIFLDRALGKEEWWADKDLVKKFKKLKRSYNPISNKTHFLNQASLRNISIDVHNHNANTCEVSLYMDYFRYYEKDCKILEQKMQTEYEEKKQALRELAEKMKEVNYGLE